MNDLTVDCRDGLLLADVVEGVTAVKVSDLVKKPKTQQQMVSAIPVKSFLKIEFQLGAQNGNVIFTSEMTWTFLSWQQVPTHVVVIFES